MTDMTTAVKQLLQSYEALSDSEKQEAAAALLRRVLHDIPADLSEESLVAAADELFRELDDREATDGQP
jgi:hypothetical protein